MRGVVKFFNRSTGYGFVVPDDGGPDVMIHAMEMNEYTRNVIFAGDRVKFDVAVTPKGHRGQNVTICGGFLIISLPDHCSHRYAAYLEETRVSEVFDDQGEAMTWAQTQMR